MSDAVLRRPVDRRPCRFARAAGGLPWLDPGCGPASAVDPPVGQSGESQAAVDALKRPREVQVQLEEGLPSPLTRRLGAIFAAAGAPRRCAAVLTRREIWRLEEAKLDDMEIVHLILSGAGSRAEGHRSSRPEATGWGAGTSRLPRRRPRKGPSNAARSAPF